MHLQPPVDQEHFFFRRIFVYLFFRPRFFVHAFVILTVFCLTLLRLCNISFIGVCEPRLT